LILLFVLSTNGANWSNVSSNEQQPRSSAFRSRCRGAGQYNYWTPSAGSSMALLLAHGGGRRTVVTHRSRAWHARCIARARVNAHYLKDMYVLRRSPFTRRPIARLLIDFARRLVSRS